jgi:RecB family exonuclease
VRHHLTASRIELGTHCLYWARPDIELPERATSAAAQLGTSLHAATEEAADADDELDSDDEEALEREFRRVMGEPSIDLGHLQTGLKPAAFTQLAKLFLAWQQWWSLPERGRWTARETAYALSVWGEGRALVSHGQRDYSDATNLELPGTVDLVELGHDGAITVWDYKTGRGPHRLVDHEHQLRHLGAAVALTLGVDEIRIGVAHVTAEDWGGDSPVIEDVATLDGFDIQCAIGEARALLEELPESKPNPGLHCEDLYCPARAVCPATRALLLDAKLELEPRRRLPLIGEIQSPEQAKAVMVGIGLVEEWIKDRERALKRYVDEKGGLVDGDRIYKGWPQTRETPRLDVKGAKEFLIEQGLDSAIKVKEVTSWKAIREALRPITKKGQLTDKEQILRAELRARGALKVSEFTQYEWKAIKVEKQKKAG